MTAENMQKNDNKKDEKGGGGWNNWNSAYGYGKGLRLPETLHRVSDWRYLLPVIGVTSYLGSAGSKLKSGGLPIDAIASGRQTNLSCTEKV